jgi:23S rRNA (cytidine2498-2'-O)-methyltransferase
VNTANTTASFIGTANRGFALYAQDEIRRFIQGAKCTELSEQEVFIFHVPLSKQQAIAAIHENQPIFLRHIQPVDSSCSLTIETSDIELLSEYIRTSVPFRSGIQIAVQIRKQDRLELPYSPVELRESISSMLESHYQIETVPRNSDFILSVYLTDEQAYIGYSKPEDNLSDWSGGAVRFQREPDQISRAKFKLLEAEHAFGLDYSAFSQALDIGAAPGGWTSLLLERGLHVTAVDPGHMHPSLIHHPKLTILRENAGDVTFPDHSFDLLVCDMSWSPRQMAKLMLPMLDALRPGGTAIITLKLLHGKPFQTVKDTSRTLAPQLELVQAKQLFHNRDEVTLFLLKR